MKTLSKQVSIFWFCITLVFSALLFTECGKKAPSDDMDDVVPPPVTPMLDLTDTVKGVYKGTLVSAGYGGTSGFSTTETKVYQVFKVSNESLQVDAFGDGAHDKFKLDGKFDTLWIFTGVNSNATYSYGLKYWPLKDSIYLYANWHISTGNGKSWTFSAKKQ